MRLWLLVSLCYDCRSWKIGAENLLRFYVYLIVLCVQVVNLFVCVKLCWIMMNFWDCFCVGFLCNWVFERQLLIVNFGPPL